MCPLPTLTHQDQRCVAVTTEALCVLGVMKQCVTRVVVCCFGFLLPPYFEIDQCCWVSQQFMPFIAKPQAMMGMDDSLSRPVLW